MGNKWPTLPLEELVENIFDRRGVTPTKLGSDFISAGNRVISAKLIKGSRIDLSVDEPRFVNAATYKKWMSSPLQEDDVIMTSEAPLGELAWVRQKLEWCLGQRLFGIRTDKKKLNGRFLFYALQSETVRNDLISRATGTTVTGIRQSELRKVAIPLPPLPEQKRIAGILGALDDKIELNRKMNETLEQMAKTLFKSWFIDFDPVHAKAAGRQPAGMDNATAYLFPDSFVDSELGKIPRGWKITSVGEAVECVGGATPSTSEPEYWQGGIHHWTTPKDFSSLASPFLLNTERKLTNAGISKISSGLLPAGTLLLSSRAPIGYIAIATIPVAINQGFIALKCNENASNFFMLNWSKSNMAEIESRATGTTFPEISKLNFRPIRVCLPPKELMSVFTSKVSPMYGKIVANLRQSRNLSAIRDTLLPGLLNGKVSTSTLPSIFKEDLV
jgi:type I restriction enzyme S subunit